MPNLLNQSSCRHLLLTLANEKWPGKMTRVSQDVFDFLETRIRSDCCSFVRNHPTVGKTLQYKTHKRKNNTEMV